MNGGNWEDNSLSCLPEAPLAFLWNLAVDYSRFLPTKLPTILFHCHLDSHQKGSGDSHFVFDNEYISVVTNEFEAS